MTARERMYWKMEDIRIERAPVIIQGDLMETTKAALEAAGERLKKSNKCGGK
jgi:hypothetical protein